MKRIVFILLILMIPIIAWASHILQGVTFRYDSHCPSDKPLSGFETECIGCDYPRGIYLNTDDQKLTDYLSACSNREIHEDNWSYLKECPSDLPIKDWNLGCHSCDELGEVMTTSAEACHVCPNRSASASGDNWACSLKQCPTDYPLLDRGDCLACDEPYRLDSTKEMCDLCPNRFYKSKNEEVESKEIDEVYTHICEDSGVCTEVMGRKKISLSIDQGGCYLLPPNEEFPIPIIDISEKSEWSYIHPIREGTIIGGIINETREIIRFQCDDCEKRHEDRQDFKTCYEKEVIITLPEFCAKCPNRVYKEGKCILKECPENSYQGLEEECFSCGDIEDHHSTEAECLKCSNRMYSKKLENCYDCRTPEALENLTKSECQKCSNRRFVGGRCLLKSCPSKSMRTLLGSCQEYGGDDVTNVSAEECLKGEKEGDYFYEADSKTCRSCHNAGSKECAEKCPAYLYSDGRCIHGGNADTKEECHLGKHYLWRGEHKYKGGTVETGLRCVSCSGDDDRDFYNIPKEECDRCSNRAWDEKEQICIDCLHPLNRLTPIQCSLCPNNEMKKDVCVPKVCPEGTFRSSLGYCLSCRDSRPSEWSSRGNEADCERCPNRFYSDGWCHWCDDEMAFSTSQKACAKCSDRVFQNGQCILAECQNGHIHDNDGDCEYCYSQVYNTTQEECNKCPNNIFFPEKKVCAYCWMTTRQECVEASEKYSYFPEKGVCCNTDFLDFDTEQTILNIEENSIALF